MTGQSKITSSRVELRSDNSAAVAPQIMAALTAANVGSVLAYGDDEVTEQLQATVRRVFEHPTARAFPVTSGTAANALSLTALCPPWGAVLCHETAHILNSECGATSMLGGGAVMRGVGGDDHRIGLDEFTAALESVRWGDPHHSQPAVVSFTQPTDMGTMYAADEIAAIADVAHARGLRVHLDGARLANTIAATGCSAADMTWRAGVDVVSLGATKNGAMSAEAIVCFDDRAAEELVYRTKRAGHVTSKMRFQSAQLIAYLTDDTWLELAANANAQMGRLAAGLAERGVELLNPPDVNMVFARVDDAIADRLEAAGLLFYRMGLRGHDRVIRFVTSWQTTDDDVDRALAAFG